MPDSTRRSTPDEGPILKRSRYRDEIIALARSKQDLTIRAIAARVDCAPGLVAYHLKRVGITAADRRSTRCSFCKALVVRARKETILGKHACSKTECRAKLRRLLTLDEQHRARLAQE